ncbi:hypothetical protein [Marinifilum caeruleilacunae]|uniref:DNA-binding protein n=1 Tax=Marinifilum caeruleilacunae TaxID=2499076 RepID=A0ABX1WYI4_9BACT|nr:hypothetical protein [Marinifilum caeruleilacunae]NOU60949.1 hypothetical protein [Marinifilum caeruleilacunae]
MKKLVLSILFVSAILLSACKNEPKQASVDVPDGREKITVSEVINGSTYSYIKGKNDKEEIWVAIRKQPIEIGKAYYYKDALPMKDFHSKELNRTFPLIYFLNSISGESKPISNLHHESMMKKPSSVKLEVDIKKTEGYTTIEELYKSKSELANSIIKVKGKVSKFNKNILNKNWVHIQDGTDHNGSFDLTITTKESVSIGEIIEFKGLLTLDKDFGAGYKYDVILEEAEIINKTKKQ